MAWLDSILIVVARFARRLALLPARQVNTASGAPGIGQQALDTYTAALRRLVLIVFVLAVTWGVVALLGRPLPTAVATLILAIFTLFLALAAWPIALVFFEREKYQKGASVILVAILGVGVLAVVFNVTAKVLPVLQVAGAYLVVSGYLGKPTGFRLLVNRIAMILIVVLVLTPVFPKTAHALSGMAPKLDNVGASVLSGTATKSLVQLAMPSHTATITLPADGLWSPVFNVQQNVPTGWYYQIDGPAGMRARWSDETTSSYKDIAQHAGQSFSLSNPNQEGGIATVEWQPAPPPPSGQ